MSNKTLIPAFRATVGDWNYYICIMKYAEVARQVNFAFELQGNKELGSLLQRGLTERAEEIVKYLTSSEHRFLGALVVAAWGGSPLYTEVQMADDDDGMLAGLDQRFGVLTFDGTQQYFALDGQHRLRAIKDAIRQNPDLGKEDICVLLVSHFETDEGRKRTRRLFTNINRHAKATSAGENYALDEDDACAVISRRLLTDHVFLRQDGRVRALLGADDEGNVKLAAKAVPKGDKKALTTLPALYQMVRQLSFGLDASIADIHHRPSDEVLEVAYDAISGRIDDLLTACGDIRVKLESSQNAADLRNGGDNEEEGASAHPFMRTLVQSSVCSLARSLVDQNIPWKEVCARLKELPWSADSAPWMVIISEEGKVRTNREFVSLLQKALLVHLAPRTKKQIREFRKEYKDTFKQDYPVSESELEKKLPGSE